MAIQIERDPLANRGMMLPAVEESQPPNDGDARKPPNQTTLWSILFSVPWWAVFIIGTGILIFINIQSNDIYATTFQRLSLGIEVTLKVSFFSYGGALIIGAIIGIIRSYQPKPGNGVIGGLLSFLHLIVYNIATIFVEVMRGLPIIVVLLVGAYIITPEIRSFVQDNIDSGFTIRGQSMETAIIALALAYGAFLSEVFRAGIQSVDKGQIEAAKSLGMGSGLVMRFIVLPQAVRRMVPPLGNDFIAMIKDSSLVTILAVRDVTQIAKTQSGSNFRVVETYLTVAFIYLTLTFIGSLLVRAIENHLDSNTDYGFWRRGLERIRDVIKARPTAQS